jgi:oxaloacetate decarboxylase gamma subunit
MDNNLLGDSITLTIFGMGFVFLFLALMVAVTNMMSLIVDKIQPTVNVPPLSSDPSNEIDDKTRAIIEAAIKMHTKR